ncbi:MAG: hypothetical protein R3E97_19930 [Candidatus Eisenbacteria bacterium]
MRDLIEILESVGFVDVERVAWTGVSTSKFTKAATFRARKPGA